MKLTIVGSGSSGNGYVIQNGDEALILEAGMPLKEIKKALDFNTYKVVGCLVTHEHQDHSKYAADYIKNGIKTYSPQETKDKLNIKTIPLKNLKQVNIGNFKVTPFLVPHDSDIECYGYLIQHTEFGKLLFLTDLAYCPYSFAKQNVDHILVECNYSEKLFNENYGKSLKTRVFETHMELETCKKFIETNNNSNLKNVILLHLSNANSDEALFLSEIQKLTSAKVQVADKGLQVEVAKKKYKERGKNNE